MCAPYLNYVKRCLPICIRNANDCDYPEYCYPLDAPLTIGTTEYGVCQ